MFSKIICHILLFLWSSYGPVTTSHEFHLSNMECNVNTADETLEITLRIFIDDLETALAKRGHEGLKICTEKEDSLAEDHIIEYLEDRLKIGVNNEEVDYSFYGKEASADLAAVWIYLAVEQQTEVQLVSIYNEILMELFDDQRNIISVKKDNERKAHWIFDQEETVNDIKL